MAHKTHAAVVVLAMLVVLVAAGCPHTPKAPPPEVTPVVNSLATPPSGVPPTVVTPSQPTGEMAKLVAAYNQVTSYHVVISTGGKVNMKADVKATDGKPVAFLVATGKGNILIQPAEQTVYLLDAKAKTAKKIGMTATTQGYTGKLPDPMVLSGKGPQIKSDAKLKDVDCWLLTWTGADGVAVSMWFSKKTGLPLQRQSGKTVTTYAYSGINKVPQGNFSVPKGYAEKAMTTTAPGTTATVPSGAATGAPKVKKNKTIPPPPGLTPAGPGGQ